MGLFDIFKINEFKQQIANLQQANWQLNQRINNLGIPDYEKVQYMIAQANDNYNKASEQLAFINNRIAQQQEELAKVNKSLNTQTNKLNKSKELVRAIQYALQNPATINPQFMADLDQYAPTATLNLKCMSIKELRKEFKDNDAQITQVLEKYSARYTSKANQAIYQLMVIALRAELQNILTKLKYDKKENAIVEIRMICQKYLEIASGGNQSIANTLSEFIKSIEYLFENAVSIEHMYYVKKEQAKQEQIAIREQMRQEAEERKALQAEQKKIEQEESKYNTEIQKLNEQLSSANDEEMAKLNARILELQAQLSEVHSKKAEISKLANGKAGNVYIISNLGSFGDNVFKVGMTRRLDPQERIDELGNASVPFKFDVHSFIFSNDAVDLENKLHTMLDAKRVNKVNTRKEFFRCSLDELEELVLSIDPTAEFNKTMAAEEFYQSNSTDGVFSPSDSDSFDDEDDE